MTNQYLTINAASSAEIEVKKSRFLAELTPASNEEEARRIIEETRKTYWNARHHCSAFILGASSDILRSSDDGEPSGTAGAPILEALRAAEITNIVAVVTRWFGGTLLGTGGLTRAYAGAAAQAIAATKIVTVSKQNIYRLDLSPANAAWVEQKIRQSGFTVCNSHWGEKVSLEIAVLAAEAEKFLTQSAQIISMANKSPATEPAIFVETRWEKTA